MKSINVFNTIGRQARYIVAAAALALSVALPALASAAQVTTRSIQLSSSSADASNVTYQVNFTAETAAGAFVIEFCNDSPLIGATCTPPPGFDASTAASSSSGVTNVAGATNRITVTGTVAAGANSFEFTNIHNPTDTGPLYARILTYADVSGANGYTTTDPDAVAEHIDEGGVAMYITNTVGVSAAVLETMTFCASGPGGTEAEPTNPIEDGCTGTLVAPTLKLGREVGGVIALDADDVYTGTIYTQISTNAAQGAVVSIKSDATGCGGLIRSSDTGACDIKPAGTSSTITKGNALFGLKLGANVADAGDGALQAATNYNDTDYHLNYDSNEQSGVTSTYGDPIFNTAGGPANNLDMPITFGASAASNTPAGNYSADLSLVATGKF